MTSSFSQTRALSRLTITTALFALLGGCGGGGDVNVGADSFGATESTALKAKTPLYSVTDLGMFAGSFSSGIDINKQGDVVVVGTNGAFLYSAGTWQDLGAGGCIQNANSVNDRGQVAGTGPSGAVLYSAGGCQALGTLGGSSGSAYDVNNKGQVTGSANLAGDAGAHAFLFSSGTMRDLGTLGGFGSAGFAINDTGQVTGWANLTSGAQRAFLYTGGTMHDLGTLGGFASQGRGINDKGQVTGTSYLACQGVPPCPGLGSHAFLYSAGTMQDLDTPGNWWSEGLGINGKGDVAGWFTNNDEVTDFRAFLYTGGAMLDLNDLLDESRAGWVLLYATSINDSGQITGTGLFNGQFRAFLLNPSKKGSEQALAV